MLKKGSSWSNPTWELQPEILPGLAASVKLLYDKSHEFTFQAVWLDKKTTLIEQRSTIEELLNDIEKNAIKRNYTYIVSRKTKKRRECRIRR
ncbi:MAG: hypothetical protein OEV59_05545 [Deltaproteobacteria bacterium]|nr:hypothetical protein [Deltaproteobacteria bacterium]